MLKWTPDDNTPDVVYYQCWFHMKLGWEIHVEGQADSNSGGTDDNGNSGGSGCSSTHEFVGRVAKFSSLQHQWKGTVTVLDDCSFMVRSSIHPAKDAVTTIPFPPCFLSLSLDLSSPLDVSTLSTSPAPLALSAQVEDFRYDGLAPAVYWWAAAGSSQDALRRGMRVTQRRVQPAPNGGVARVISLGDGLTWSDVPVLAGWCEAFNALFGLVDLREATVPGETDGSSCDASPLPNRDCVVTISSELKVCALRCPCALLPTASFSAHISLSPLPSPLLLRVLSRLGSSYTTGCTTLQV